MNAKINTRNTNQENQHCCRNPDQKFNFWIFYTIRYQPGQSAVKTKRSERVPAWKTVRFQRRVIKKRLRAQTLEKQFECIFENEGADHGYQQEEQGVSPL